MQIRFKTYSLLYVFMALLGYTTIAVGSDRQNQFPMLSPLQLISDGKLADDEEIASSVQELLTYPNKMKREWWKQLPLLLPTAVSQRLPKTVNMLLQEPLIPIHGTIEIANKKRNAFEIAFALTIGTLRYIGDREDYFKHDCEIIRHLLEKYPQWATQKITFQTIPDQPVYTPLEWVEARELDIPKKDLLTNELLKAIRISSEPSFLDHLWNPKALLAGTTLMLGAAVALYARRIHNFNWLWSWLLRTV